MQNGSTLVQGEFNNYSSLKTINLDIFLSMHLLTRSLRKTHARCDVSNMADLATKLSKLRPTFLRDFLSPDEENTLFSNDLNEEFVFFQLFVFILGAN